MTKNSIKKYFDRRPGVDTLYRVDGVVFTDELVAANYADQFCKVMETHYRNDEDVEGEIEGTAEETIEPTAADAGSAIINEDVTGDGEKSDNTEAEVIETASEDQSDEAVEAVDASAPSTNTKAENPKKVSRGGK